MGLILDLARDAGLAIRMLRRSPGVAAAAIVSLALGIGAASSIFSVVNAVLLRPLDYREPERLVVVRHGGPAASASTFLAWRARAGTLDRIGAAEYWSPNLAGAERTEQIVALQCRPTSCRCSASSRCRTCLHRRGGTHQHGSRRRRRPPILEEPARGGSRCRGPAAHARWRALHDRRRHAGAVSVRAVLGDESRGVDAARPRARKADNGRRFACSRG